MILSNCKDFDFDENKSEILLNILNLFLKKYSIFCHDIKKNFFLKWYKIWQILLTIYSMEISLLLPLTNIYVYSNWFRLQVKTWSSFKYTQNTNQARSGFDLSNKCCKMQYLSNSSMIVSAFIDFWQNKLIYFFRKFKIIFWFGIT